MQIFCTCCQDLPSELDRARVRFVRRSVWSALARVGTTTTYKRIHFYASVYTHTRTQHIRGLGGVKRCSDVLRMFMSLLCAVAARTNRPNSRACCLPVVYPFRVHSAPFFQRKKHIRTEIVYGA